MYKLWWYFKIIECIKVYHNCFHTFVSFLDGGWTEWSDGVEDGVQTRSRQCSNPTPANRGIPCEGEMEETLLCTNNLCPGAFL